MNFLKKLGTPFVALWRWIKETAWVQPLLIVGVIFAIIFSIPSITSWVQSWDFGDDKYNWLENKQLSLEGITDEKIDGEAADFFSTFEEAQSLWKNDKKDEARKTMKSYTGDADKLFLYFVQENDAANNINEANKYLVEEAWKNKVTSRAEEAKKQELKLKEVSNIEQSLQIKPSKIKMVNIFMKVTLHLNIY